MLKIVIPECSFYNDRKEEFININKRTELHLEHSLISLSKWEAIWHKPFFGKEEKTEEMIRDYIRCMTITQNVNPDIYYCIPETELQKIFEYIEDPMTATWFGSKNDKNMNGNIPKKEIITAEIIYYWMITLNIPKEFEKWHLNRLLTLIRVINVKNEPSKKLNKKDIYARNARINAMNRAKYRTKG